MKLLTKLVALAVAGSLALAACGADDEPADGGGDDATDAAPSTTEAQTSQTTAADDEPFAVQAASYDLAADGPQRFIVGLIGTDGGVVVGGNVELEFRYLGTDPQGDVISDGSDVVFEDVAATFLPVAAGAAPPPGQGPRMREGDEGVGVYEARDVEFDRPGTWGVIVHATIEGQELSLPTTFEVTDAQRIVSIGDPAPRTANLLPGAPDAPPTAVDSRVEDDGSVPDPERRIRYLDGLRQITHAQLSRLRQRVEDPRAGRVAEQLETTRPAERLRAEPPVEPSRRQSDPGPPPGWDRCPSLRPHWPSRILRYLNR